VSDETAFVGDIHGNLDALRGLVDAITTRGGPHMVFLGDYINKGPHSAEVMDELVALSGDKRATLLVGNHETALLDALDTEDLMTFLKMGGAMTIRSYVGTRVGPDVLGEFRASLPPGHLGALRQMPQTWESNWVIAQHVPPDTSTQKYCISAHVPVGQVPRIGQTSSQVDTGCGAESGRLTALMWPSLDFIQVDSRGEVVSRVS
jgi:serine/threonine protein phosphatase 1